jgi:RIO-like serine/threonine protein kinase
MSIFFSKIKLNFAQLWDIKTDWFEEPNHRRGGWSGVVRYKVPAKKGKIQSFIKRQENHFSRTWLHPFSGIPTFQKEFENINRLIKHQIPTLEVLFFGKEHNRAIIVTKALEDYVSLDQIDPHSLSKKDKHLLLKRIAETLTKMHKVHYQHSSFYPKHIFVRQNADGWDVKIIDLENLRWRLFLRPIMNRDLSTLDRHLGSNWSVKDRLVFLHYYFDEKKLSKTAKQIWYKLQSKDAYKRRN